MNLNRNVLIHFIGKLLPAASQLIIMIAGLRILGTEEYGKYNLLFNASMIICYLVAGWIQQSILRYFLAAGNEKGKYKLKFYTLAFWSSMVSFTVMMIFGWFYFKPGINLLLIVSVFTAVYGIFLVILTIKQAELNAGSYAFTESLFHLLTIAFLGTGIYFSFVKDSQTIFIILLAALSITMFFKGYSSGTHPSTYYKIVAQSPSRKFFRQMLDYGIPITVWALISNFYNVSDRFIIKYFNGFEAVGIYGSVYDLVYKVCGFMTLPVLLAYHPALSATWGKQEYNSSRSMISRAVVKVTAITIFVFVIMFLFRDFIFGLLFNADIPVLDELFVPIALSSILWQVALIIQKPLEFNMKRSIMIRGIVITVLINAILNFISIPVFGYEAAAYNTFISTFFYFLYVIYFSRNEINKFIER